MIFDIFQNSVKISGIAYREEFCYKIILRSYSAAFDDGKKVKNRVQDFLNPLKKPNSLKQLAKNFEEQLVKALNPTTKDQSSLKCYNTHIQNIRAGHKKGEYLSTHLGGTVLNFMRISVDGPNQFTPRGLSKKVPEIMKKSSGEMLFNYIAEELRDFVWVHFSFRTMLVPLVFCFSFPLEQTSLDRGTIRGWAKGYLCEKTVGKNVNTLLRHAALNKGLSLDIKAVINDVGAAFVVGRTQTRLCSGSVVLGSGTNASYLESVKNVVGFQGDFTSPHVLINTEWGGYGEKGELNEFISDFDREADLKSENPGIHIFEKMTGGLYIGEIARLFFVRLTEEKLLFGGMLSDKLKKRGVFKSDHLLNFISDDLKTCEMILNEVLQVQYSQEDLLKVKEVCWAVSERTSLLVAACLAGLAQRMAQPVSAFATEGRLINRGLPNLADVDIKALAITHKPVKKIYTVPTYGSALKGSALLASCF